MKKEAKLNVISNNYTPVSLTNVLCKVMESVIRDHIMKFFLDNDLFSNMQYNNNNNDRLTAFDPGQPG